MQDSKIWLAKERMIGWYHTGPKLRSSDLEINELMKRYVQRPVLVIVTVKPNNDVGLPTDSYFAVEEVQDVRPGRVSPRALMRS